MSRVAGSSFSLGWMLLKALVILGVLTIGVVGVFQRQNSDGREVMKETSEIIQSLQISDAEKSFCLSRLGPIHNKAFSHAYVRRYRGTPSEFDGERYVHEVFGPLSDAAYADHQLTLASVLRKAEAELAEAQRPDGH